MKSWSLGLLLGLVAWIAALAQAAPAPGAPAAGPSCDQLTQYGQLPSGGLPKGAPLPAAAPLTVRRPAPVAIVPDAPQLPYRFVDAPPPPQGAAFTYVNGVGLLKNGRLLVNQRAPAYELLEYTPDNRLIANLDPNITARPHGMRIDKDDNIWLTDQQCNIVVKLNPEGRVLMTLGTVGKAGSWDEAKGAHLFNQPTDVAFAPNGDVLVSTGHGGPDPRIVRFDRTGKFITTWTVQHADGSAPVLHTLVVNARGEVWVGDREVKRMWVFDLNGKPIRQIQMQNLITGLFIDAKGQLWMTSGTDGMVMKLDWNGKVLGYLGKQGAGKNQFGEAHYMTMTPDGKTMYVADAVNNDVKKLELVK